MEDMKSCPYVSIHSKGRKVASLLDLSRGSVRNFESVKRNYPEDAVAWSSLSKVVWLTTGEGYSRLLREVVYKK